MDSIKTAILASDKLMGDFDGCVTLYKDFMIQNEGISGGDKRNISAFQGDGGGNDNGGGGGKNDKNPQQEEEGDGKCEDIYYSSKEYSTLSKTKNAHLRKLWDAREKAGGDRNW